MCQVVVTEASTAERRSSTSSFTVSVFDRNDFAPVFQAASYSVNVPEGDYTFSPAAVLTVSTLPCCRLTVSGSPPLLHAHCQQLISRSMLTLPHSTVCALPVSLTLRSPCLTPHSMLTLSRSSHYSHFELPASCPMEFILPCTPPSAESLAVAFCQTCSPAPTGGPAVCHRVPQPRIGQHGHTVCHCVPQPRIRTRGRAVCHCVPQPRIGQRGYAVCHRVQHAAQRPV